MKSSLLLLLLFVIHMCFPVVNAEKPINVGIDVLEFEDQNRRAWGSSNPRPIVSHLFYPTHAQHAQPILIGAPEKELFDAGVAVWGAQPMGTIKRPLIVLSHGTGGSALQMLWLAQALVQQGYVVMGVNHHGNTAIEQSKSAAAYVLWWERAQDLNVALERLLANDAWSKVIDSSKVGVAGFSLGGYTAISSVGGVTNTALFKAFCDGDQRDATCELQPEFPTLIEEFELVSDSQQVKESFARQQYSYENEKFKAAFVIAPAVAQSFTSESLAAINVPVMISAGSDDRTAPLSTNAQYLASQIKDASLTIVAGAGHYSFLSKCTEFGARVLGALCSKTLGTSRADIHQVVSEQAVNFFDQVFYSEDLQKK